MRTALAAFNGPTFQVKEQNKNAVWINRKKFFEEFVQKELPEEE